MQTLQMILGERRRPRLTVSAPEPFTIHDAAYVLSNDGIEVDSGSCDIEGHDLLLTLEPTKRGSYILTYTMTIAGERIKTRVYVVVS